MKKLSILTNVLKKCSINKYYFLLFIVCINSYIKNQYMLDTPGVCNNKRNEYNYKANRAVRNI